MLRKDAAIAGHELLLKHGISDLPDIFEASELKDLYDCRVCVNHIAQVYLRHIMDAHVYVLNERKMPVFEAMTELTLPEEQAMIAALEKYGILKEEFSKELF